MANETDHGESYAPNEEVIGEAIPVKKDAIQPIYTKQTWADGDIITADKMNHIEDGLNNLNGIGYRVAFSYTDDTASCNRTYEEIYTALSQGKNVFGVYDGKIFTIKYISKIDSESEAVVYPKIYFDNYFMNEGSGILSYIEFTINTQNDVTYTKSVFYLPTKPQ